MKGNDWLWLILAVVVVAAVVVSLAMAGGRRRTRQAERAASLRAEATEQADLVRQREIKATEVGARAQGARAEADAKAAEAERLTLMAERQRAEASEQRSQVDEQFRRADKIDPSSNDARTGNVHAEEEAQVEEAQVLAPQTHSPGQTPEDRAATPDGERQR